MSSVESIGDFALNLIEQELESPTPTSRNPFTGVQAEKGQADISDIEVPSNMRNQILNESFSVEAPQEPEEKPEVEEIPEIEISTPEEPQILHEHAALVERFEGAVRELTSVLREMTGSGFVGGEAKTTVGRISPNFAGTPKKSRKSRRKDLLNILGKK
tara:strand:- start:1328 stop:1804 length:477 start_codon:yes stop_codon:yes gene_type:complete